MGGSRRGGAVGGSSSRRMAQAPRNSQQRRARQQERRDARRARRMAQVDTPDASTQQPGVTTRGNEGFDLSSLFSVQEKPKDFRSVEFDDSSLVDPYQKYAEDPENGWITGLMKSGQKGYDLPKEVTLAAAMNSPFRYYGGY